MGRPQLLILSILIAVLLLAESFQARTFNSSKISTSKNSYEAILLKIKDIKESPEYLDLKRLNQEFASKVKVVESKMATITSNEAFYKNSHELIANLEKEREGNKEDKALALRKLTEAKRRRSRIEKELKDYPKRKEELLTKSIEYERELDEILYPYKVLNDEITYLSNQASLMVKVNDPKYLKLKRDHKKIKSQIQKIKQIKSEINSNKILYNNADTIIKFMRAKKRANKDPSQAASVIADISQRRGVIRRKIESYPQQEKEILKTLEGHKLALNKVNFSYKILTEEIRTLKKALRVRRNRTNISRVR